MLAPFISSCVTRQSPFLSNYKNELTRLGNKLAVRDLSILVFIKVAEVRVGEGGPRSTDYCEFGWIEMPVAVAVGQGK